MTQKYTEVELEALTGFSYLFGAPASVENVPYTTCYVSVLNFIPKALHKDIRLGTCTVDLTAYIQAALDWLYAGDPTDDLGAKAEHKAPVLFFPAGIYPIRALCWNGRVPLIGEGRARTRLVYAPPATTPESVECESLIVTDLRFSGPRAPAATHAGISDLALVGFRDGAYAANGVCRMARQLLVFKAGIDIRFRFDRTWIGLCRGDAVVLNTQITNLHVDDVEAVGIGGYAFTVAPNAKGLGLNGCVCCQPPGRSVAPAAPPSSGDPTKDAAMAASPPWERAGLGDSNETPIGFSDISWSPQLPATVVKEWQDLGTAKGFDRLTSAWGRGLLHLVNTAGACLGVDGAMVDARSKHAGGGSIIEVEQASDGGTSQLSVRDLVGRARTEDGLVVVQLRGLPQFGTAVVDANNFAATLRAVAVNGTTSAYHELLPRPEFYDSYLYPNARAAPALSEYDLSDGGYGATGMRERRAFGIVLGGRRLGVMPLGLDFEIRLGKSAEVVRTRRGDIALVAETGYPQPSTPGNGEPAWPTSGRLGQLVLPGMEPDPFCLKPNDAGVDASMAAQAAPTCFFVWQYGNVALRTAATTPAGAVGGVSALRLAPKSNFIGLYPGDTVCILASDGRHWHRVVTGWDPLSRDLRLDSPLVGWLGQGNVAIRAVSPRTVAVLPIEGA